jgi:hypothetical protein
MASAVWPRRSSVQTWLLLWHAGEKVVVRWLPSVVPIYERRKKTRAGRWRAGHIILSCSSDIPAYRDSELWTCDTVQHRGLGNQQVVHFLAWAERRGGSLCSTAMRRLQIGRFHAGCWFMIDEDRDILFVMRAHVTARTLWTSLRCEMQL